MSIWLIILASYCIYVVLSRFITIYLCYRVYGFGRDNPCQQDETRGFMWIPLFGDAVMFNVLASELGYKTYQANKKQEELNKQLRETLKTELSRNKDLLIAAIEEVEQLKAS